MKRQLFFIAMVSLFTSLASATDLYVRNLGTGGAYSTISAAITAAANGDRIIIQPKAGGAAYIENLTINKSLTFISETNFAKYIVQGTVTITPLAGRVVTINNLSLTSSMTVSTATTGGRTTVNILNSLMNTVTANQSNTSLNISGCDVTNEVNLSHGRCTGNKFGALYYNLATIDTNPSTDDIEVFGNAISYGIYINQKTYNFKLLNNFISDGLISINGVKNSSTNEIINNVVMGGDQSPIMVDLTAGNTGAISVLNNILNMLFSNNQINNANTNATVNASYNMSSSFAFTSTNVTSTSNVGSAALTINTATYTVTGANVNAGSTATEYTDLDLSRNDIGNFGGSNSWSNYWPTGVGNKPQVNYLNTPRVINSGTTTLNVTGSGYSK